MARIPVATDNFNRSNGDIGGNYTLIGDSLLSIVIDVNIRQVMVMMNRHIGLPTRLKTISIP